MKLIRVVSVSVQAEAGRVVLMTDRIRRDDIVVLVLTGSDVSSRDLTSGVNDPVLHRIENNGNLVWTKYADKICYVRKETVEKASILLGGAYLADVIVSDDSAAVGILLPERIAALSRSGFIVRDRKLLERVAEQLYVRLRLPLLGFWFVLLVLNFILSTSLSRQIGEAQMMASQSRKVAEREAAFSSGQQRVATEYRSLALPDFAIEIDRLASLIPEGIVLTRLDVGKEGLRVDGLSDEVSLVVEFASRARIHSRRVELVSIEKAVSGGGFTFEMTVSI